MGEKEQKLGRGAEAVVRRSTSWEEKHKLDEEKQAQVRGESKVRRKRKRS